MAGRASGRQLPTYNPAIIDIWVASVPPLIYGRIANNNRKCGRKTTIMLNIVCREVSRQLPTI